MQDMQKSTLGEFLYLNVATFAMCVHAGDGPHPDTEWPWQSQSVSRISLNPCVVLCSDFISLVISSSCSRARSLIICIGELEHSSRGGRVAIMSIFVTEVSVVVSAFCRLST